LYLVFLLKTHPDYFTSVTVTETEHEHEHAQWPAAKAVAMLIGASVLAGG
jgi:hypothetical protein